MAKLDLVGIIVKDMGKALQFYRELGLNIPAGAENEGHVQFTTPNGYQLAWDTEEVIKSFLPDWHAPDGSRIGLAFACENAADVDATHRRLVGKGYRSHKDPFDAFWGQRYALILDPDGNSIDLFAPL